MISEKTQESMLSIVESCEPPETRKHKFFNLLKSCGLLSSHATILKDLRGLNLITPDEFANIIGYSPSTLNKWRNKKHGPPYYRFGPPGSQGHVRYEENQSLLWVMSCHVTPKNSVLISSSSEQAPKYSSLSQMSFLTPEQMAAKIQYATSTLAAWRHRKYGLPYYQFGPPGSTGYIRYEESESLDWIATRRVAPENRRLKDYETADGYK